MTPQMKIRLPVARVRATVAQAGARFGRAPGRHTRRLLPATGLVWALLAPAALNVGVVAAQATTPTPTPVPSAAQTWEVQAGGGDTPTTPPGPPLFEAMAYGPGPVIIHVGDTVSWRFAGLHTVTFNSGKPPLPLIVPGSAPGELVLGPAFFPAGVTGTRTNYDGTAQVSSGAPEDDPSDFRFELTFTRPGLFGYTCELHPGMRAEVEVAAANVALPENSSASVGAGPGHPLGSRG